MERYICYNCDNVVMVYDGKPDKCKICGKDVWIKSKYTADINVGEKFSTKEGK